MSVIGTLILFVIGFYILIKGAQVLVDGASSVAKFFHISPWVIGVVIVGIGTSVPELSINLASVFNGGDIGVGTVIGSNIFNLLFIMGVVALVSPVVMRRVWLTHGFFSNAGAVLVSSLFMLLPILGDRGFLGITRGEGAVIFTIFVLWILYMVLRKQEDMGESHSGQRVFTLFTSFLLIVAGIIGVFIGGRWVVSGAETLARLAGVSEALIGLTIVAMGTSIPELAVSVSAALRGRSDIAVGNIIGSNVFDFLGIFGTIPLIKSLSVPEFFGFDIAALSAAIIIFFGALFFGERYKLKRYHGALFIAVYVLYIAFLFARTPLA